MALILLPTHLASYQLWLQSRQYKSNTIRNYLQDLKLFLSFANSQISLSILEAFIRYISPKKNSKRYLASLSVFCQFLLSQQLTSKNLFKKAQKRISSPAPDSLNTLLMQYQDFLSKQNNNKQTIENHLNNIHQYLDWYQSHET